MDKQSIRLSMAGNPNVGKSVIFNALTGSRQHVGNWPGKTVERAEGICAYRGYEIRLVDLPGTYSLAAQSPEEVIARDYIISGEPDVVINVVDVTNLERNLNLTLQILELTGNVVIALNLMDELKSQGQAIDVEALEKALGVPVIPTVAIEGKGLQALTETAVAVAEGNRPTHPTSVDFGVTVEGHMKTLQDDLKRAGIEGRRRWLGLKLLEDDPEVVRAFKQGDLTSLRMEAPTVSKQALQAILNHAVRLREGTHPDAKVEIVRRRFEFSHNTVHRAVSRLRLEEESPTEKIDRIVTHPIWSWPITPGPISRGLLDHHQGWRDRRQLAGHGFIMDDRGRPHSLDAHPSTVVGGWGSGGWLYGRGWDGHHGHVTPDDDPVYRVCPAGRPGTPAPHGLQPGPPYASLGVPRQADTYLGNVLWLQRDRRDGLANH